MKIFPDSFSRSQNLWLLVHGVLAGYLTAGLAHISIEYIPDSRHFPELRIILAAVGTSSGMVAGVFVTLLCAIRLRKAFTVLRMRTSMLGIVVVEVIILWLSGFILDCGETGYRLLMVAVALNLFLITFQHKFPDWLLERATLGDKQSPGEPKEQS